jgi:signal transduction histidine kinase
MDLHYEQDVVASRQRARQIAELLGFEPQDQTRIATAVSEIARNAFRYGVSGKAEFLLDKLSNVFVIRISDAGPGIERLDDILNGSYESSTGMGLGILGARRLSDSFSIESEIGSGTTVQIERKLPQGYDMDIALNISNVAGVLTQQLPSSSFDEIQQQNKELLQALDTVQTYAAEIDELNRELRETNRGVVALYAELDEKAISLQSVSELKSQFIANMSHEFRTPLASITSLGWLLLNEVDGPLTQEQHKQITLIRQSSQSLAELINDLLDIAKIESGKIDVRIHDFAVNDMFSALRGMFKPLLRGGSPSLIIDDIPRLTMSSDEGKVSQILRNLISNAIKFTPGGEVRVKADASGGTIIFSVTDTGIGIAQEHLQLIFEEFHQVKGTVQDGVKGTGLGLPLSRRLAEILGGTLTVESVLGRGSTFRLSLPIKYARTPPDAEMLEKLSIREKVYNG